MSFILFVFIILFCPLSFSQVTLDTRFEFNSRNFYGKNSEGGDSAFRFAPLRLDFRGNLKEGLDYRLRFRLDRAYQTPNATDGIHSGVDLAFLTRKFNTNSRITLGRLASEVGGFEGQTTSSELYMPSEVFSGRDLKGEQLLGFGSTNYLYPSGIKYELSFLSHDIILLLANRPGHTTEEKNTTYFYGFELKSNWQDKGQTLLSFYFEPGNQQDSRQFLSFGWQRDLESHLLKIESLVLRERTLLEEKYLFSYIAQWDYRYSEEFNFQNKFIQSEYQGALDVDFHTTRSFSSVVEYFEDGERSLRYFAGINLKNRPSSHFHGEAESLVEFLLGFRLLGTILE